MWFCQAVKDLSKLQFKLVFKRQTLLYLLDLEC